MSPLLTLTAGRDAFVAGKASAHEQFGVEGPLLLIAGCLAIFVICALIIWSHRRHLQVIARLDSIEALIGGEETRHGR